MTIPRTEKTEETEPILSPLILSTQQDDDNSSASSTDPLVVGLDVQWTPGGSGSVPPADRSHHRLDIWRLVDIRDYLPTWLWKCSFERIVEECLGHQGVRKDDEIGSRSNWGARSLSDDQIIQASHDVFVCCKLGVKESVWKMRA
ncbi:unnamed protein product [Arabidopsis halleri]